MNNNYYGDDDLIINPTSRIAVCLCVDISASMLQIIDFTGAVPTGRTEFRDGILYDIYKGGRCLLDNLNVGVNTFYDTIRNDDTAALSCELAVVAFSDDATCIEDFSTIDRKGTFNIGYDQCGNDSYVAKGVNKAIDLLEKRKLDYKRNGVDYYQPWLVIFSDGNSTDDVSAVQARCKQLESEKKLTIFTFSLADEVNKEVLKGFSKRQPIPIKQDKIAEFFEWLGKSVSVVSKSKKDDTVHLDTSSLDDWGDI